MTAAKAPKLSRRQQEILSLIARGHSNQEIAGQLGLTTGTVKQHIYVLYRKLGVRNRAMAVARGAQFLQSADPDQAEPASGLSAREENPVYARRLVTAVVIEPRPDAIASSLEAEHLTRALDALRVRAGQFAHSFDGRHEPLPGGGVAVWFGQPTAHGDDAARALAYVRAVLARTADGTGDVAVAVGIGTAPEVIGEGVRASLAFRAFRIATTLASFCRPGEVLACELSASLARIDDVPERSWRPAPGSLPMPARVVEPDPPPTPAVARRWGGLPFVPAIAGAVRRRRMQWVAVESWPPIAGTRLIHALGEAFALLGLPVHRLWMPTAAPSAGLASRLVGQIYGAGGTATPARLDVALADLTSGGPACVLAHGIDALAGLVDIIGSAGLDRLRESPLVLVAGAMHRSGHPRTVLRLLGNSPLGSPFARVFRMEVPVDENALTLGIRSDVQAVLDGVSASARAVARSASEPACTDVAGIAQRLGLPVEEVVGYCHELESAGLIVLDGGEIRFRDPQTIGAVRASLV